MTTPESAPAGGATPQAEQPNVTFISSAGDPAPITGDPVEAPTPARAERNAQVYELADRRPMMVSPPPNAAFGDAYQPYALSAVKTLQDYVKTAQEVRGDPTLTDIGKAKKLEQPLAKAAMDLHKIADTVLGKGAAPMSKRADLLGVPSVEPGNAAQQLADRECREWFRGLSADERAEVMPKLMSGKLPAIAKALARSPIPLNLDEQKIEQAWRESVIASDPETFANMDKETEAADWAYLLVQRAAEKFLGSHGVTSQAVARILADAGVDDAGPFKGVTLPHKWK